MKSTSITHHFLIVLLSLLTLMASSPPAGAQTAPRTSYTFIVTTTADTHDAHPGDGTCADKQGHCSLRAAIEEADALPGSSSTITMPAGTYALTLGTLPLTGKRTITINGASSKTTIISGNLTFGIMYISIMVSVSLSQLTIEKGSASEGGAISNSGTLTVSRSTFSSNSANNGGSIANLGTLSVSRSTFSSNSANIGGFGGGGIFNYFGPLTLTTSTLSGNSASFGGGIENYSAMLSVDNSTLSGNSASSGGIYNDFGTVNVSNSTLSGNSATGSGRTGYGGGIYSKGYTLSMSQSTLSGNSASSGGSIYNAGSTVTLTGTIVANSPVGSNCAGTISEGVGYNLDSGTSCGFRLRTDLTDTDPELGPLGHHGGPTQTMALLRGSKAIDWVAPTSCLITDQRGQPRPDHSERICDIGAYESAY